MEKLRMGTFTAAPADLTYQWDGRKLRIDGPFGEPTVLWHEIGHFLAATEGRRKLPEYGLGHGPAFEVRVTTGALVGIDGKAARCTVREALSEMEEDTATTLAEWAAAGFQGAQVLSLFSFGHTHILGRALDTLHTCRIPLGR